MMIDTAMNVRATEMTETGNNKRRDQGAFCMVVMAVS